jgi:Ca-activated chloride channel family protein
MLRLNNTLTFYLCIFCFFALAAYGQEGLVYRTDTRLVDLHVSVVDRNGKLVTDLPWKAFKVFENGVEQQIKIFRQEDIPVSLGLVIDNSGSMLTRRQKVEAAALRLVKASNPEDQVFIVNFNDEAYLDCPFTNSIAKLEEGVARIDSRGGTAMRDAIGMSIDYMKEEAKLDKKVILVVTDGDDNMSSATLEQLVEKAQRAEVLVYTIGLLNEEDRRVARRAKRALDAITSASGGLPYYPQQLAEVDQLALQVAHEIRNQYILAYTPSDPSMNGGYRQIRVTVDGPNRPVARTRTGYYATPEGRPKPAAPKPAGGGD